MTDLDCPESAQPDTPPASMEKGKGKVHGVIEYDNGTTALLAGTIRNPNAQCSSSSADDAAKGPNADSPSPAQLRRAAQCFAGDFRVDLHVLPQTYALVVGLRKNLDNLPPMPPGSLSAAGRKIGREVFEQIFGNDEWLEARARDFEDQRKAIESGYLQKHFSPEGVQRKEDLAIQRGKCLFASALSPFLVEHDRLHKLDDAIRNLSGWRRWLFRLLDLPNHNRESST